MRAIESHALDPGDERSAPKPEKGRVVAVETGKARYELELELDEGGSRLITDGIDVQWLCRAHRQARAERLVERSQPVSAHRR